MQHWMGLEMVIPGGLGQTEKGKYHDTAYMPNLKQKRVNLFAKQIDSIDSIDLENKLKVTRGEKWGGGGIN